MRLSRARMAVALAAPAGVLGGHAIGYLAGGAHARSHAVDHSYLGVVATLATPLVVAAVLVAAAGGRSRPRPVPVTALLAAQWILFAGQEMAEHALAGHGAAGALASPAVWVGLAAQGLTALALAVLLRVAALTGQRALASVSHVVPVMADPTGWARLCRAWAPPVPLAAAVPARAPPPSLA